MFKIEKNIPYAGKTIYPFDQMDKDDSFFVKTSNRDKKLHSVWDGRVSVAVSTQNRKFPKLKFAKKSVIENGIKGFRVWRIK